VSAGLLVLCVCVAIAAGWWVGAQARERAREPKTLAGKARAAATRGLGSLLKQLVSRERDEEED
jgi:hypothetical protein